MLDRRRARTLLGPGPVGFLFRASLLFAGLILFTMLAVFAHATWLGEFHPRLRPAGVIIVLGGTMTVEGRLGSDTEARTRTGIDLYKQGLAPRIHFTGGVASNGMPGPGTQMRDLAISLGVPAEATSAENLSESTLQNALFSLPILGKLAEGRVILVSDGYHLGRAWASFRWAGYGPTELYARDSFGRLPRREQVRRLFRESLSWYFNPVRVLIWQVAGFVGVPESERVWLLD